MTAPDPRLGEIADRLYAVTTGPWQHEPYGGQNQNGDYAGGLIIDGHGEWLLSDVSDRDGAFIAAAPADVAYLLAELAARDEALDEYVAKYGEHATDSRVRDCPACAAAIRVRARIRAAVAAATGGGDQ